MSEFDAVSAIHCEKPESVMELPLLLSRQQMHMLATVAQRQGLTSAQFLRKFIRSVCETEVQQA